MLATVFALSLVLALVASAWIDSLYQKEREILAFPARDCASVYRMPLLVLGLGLTTGYLAGEELLLSDLLKRLLLTFFLLMTIVTDFEQHLIFDRMQLPFALLALLFAFMTGQMSGHLLAAVAGGSAFLLLALITRGAIGGGDIKLMFVLGLWLGMEKLLQVIAGGFILGGLVAGVMLLSGRWKRDEHFAYSPYFSVIALILLLV